MWYLSLAHAWKSICGSSGPLHQGEPCLSSVLCCNLTFRQIIEEESLGMACPKLLHNREDLDLGSFARLVENAMLVCIFYLELLKRVDPDEELDVDLKNLPAGFGFGIPSSWEPLNRSYMYGSRHYTS